jgi:Flp pilus assembly protein CpaB
MATTAATYPRAIDTIGVNYARAIFGLAVALVGAALVLVLYVRGQPQTVQVLKAARDLPPGTVLRPDDLIAETEPLSDGLSALVVRAGDRDAVIGHPLGGGLSRGLPLARAQVLDIAERIPDGQRVVALPVTPETAAGGQIVPGNDVEILATLDEAKADLARTIVVVERARVYAIGVQPQPTAFGTSDRASAGTKPLSWLSVLTDADQALAIATARATGELQVNLLPPLRTDTSSRTQASSERAVP